ncbi:MAG TPA: cupin domain-containing protein [archaeon]|nr:cupin domain-containing protein [archaeon]
MVKIKSEFSEPFILKNLVSYHKGSIVSKTIEDKKTGTVTVFAFDAGQKLSEHKAPFNAIVYLVEGEGEFIVGGKKHLLKAGEILIMPKNIPHSVNAKKRFKMMLVMIRGYS